MKPPPSSASQVRPRVRSRVAATCIPLFLQLRNELIALAVPARL